MPPARIKVVYNARHGGFDLSSRGWKMLQNLGVSDTSARHDLRLIKVVEEMGAEANGTYANLCIREIEGNLYRIEENDGAETVQTPADISWIEVDRNALEAQERALETQLGEDSERSLKQRVWALDLALQTATHEKRYAEVAFLADRLEKLLKEQQLGSDSSDWSDAIVRDGEWKGSRT